MCFFLYYHLILIFQNKRKIKIWNWKNKPNTKKEEIFREYI